MSMKWFSEEETEEINGNIIPTRFVGSLPRVPHPTTPDQLMPLLQLVTMNRPDVEDFVRVLRAEGLPSEKLPPPIYGGGNAPGLLLQFRVREPVVCAFNIFLRWPDDESVLLLMAASGALCFFVGKEYRDDRGFCMTVNQAELSRIIRVWKHHSQED